MTTYTIRNSDGNIVTTISPLATTGNNFPIVLPGQNVTPYGEIINQDLYWLMENFASSTPPANPVRGMLWFDIAGMLYVYNGTDWVLIGGNNANASNVVVMEPSASNVDLTVNGTTTIYVNRSTNDFVPTKIVIKPNGTPSATAPAIVNFNVINQEDVVENTPVMIDPDTVNIINVQGKTRVVHPNEGLQISVVNPATGGNMNVDVVVYGA